MSSKTARAASALKSGVVLGGTAVLSAVNSITPHMSGAVDIMVVEQPDGTFKSTPFYVRFGKYQPLRSKDRLVKLFVNGQEAEFNMHLGTYGQAYFAAESSEFEDEDAEDYLSGMASPPSGYSSGDESPPYANADILSAVQQEVEALKQAQLQQPQQQQQQQQHHGAGMSPALASDASAAAAVAAAAVAGATAEQLQAGGSFNLGLHRASSVDYRDATPTSGQDEVLLLPDGSASAMLLKSPSKPMLHIIGDGNTAATASETAPISPAQAASSSAPPEATALTPQDLIRASQPQQHTSLSFLIEVCHDGTLSTVISDGSFTSFTRAGSSFMMGSSSSSIVVECSRAASAPELGSNAPESAGPAGPASPKPAAPSQAAGSSSSMGAHPGSPTRQADRSSPSSPFSNSRSPRQGAAAGSTAASPKRTADVSSSSSKQQEQQQEQQESASPASPTLPKRTAGPRQHKSGTAQAHVSLLSSSLKDAAHTGGAGPKEAAATGAAAQAGSTCSSPAKSPGAAQYQLGSVPTIDAAIAAVAATVAADTAAADTAAAAASPPPPGPLPHRRSSAAIAVPSTAHSAEASEEELLSGGTPPAAAANGHRPFSNTPPLSGSPAARPPPSVREDPDGVTRSGSVGKAASDLLPSHGSALAALGLQGFELSVCGSILRKDMSPAEVKAAFDDNKLGPAEFSERAGELARSPQLMVKVGGVVCPWQAAMPVVLASLAFGSRLESNWEQLAKLELQPELMDMVWKLPLEEGAGKDAAGKEATSGRWRLWPFSGWSRNPSSLGTSPPLQSGSGTPPREGSPKPPAAASPRASSQLSREAPGSSSLLHAPSSPQPGTAPSSPGGPLNPVDTPQSSLRRKKHIIITKKTLNPSAEQLSMLRLKVGQNTISFKIGNSTELRAYIYLLKWNMRLLISDVDGTITRSDLLGHVLPSLGVDWSHAGITELFSNIVTNGYQIMFLSSRAISQANITRDYLHSLQQGGHRMPLGPVIISPHGLLPSLYREMILRRPHEFKIACLQDIRALFPPDWNPFYAGFGNRDTDVTSYREVGVPLSRIFIINPKGEIKKASSTVQSSTWSSLRAINDLVHQVFPPVRSTRRSSTASADSEADVQAAAALDPCAEQPLEREEFNDLQFWRKGVELYSLEDELEAVAAAAAVPAVASSNGSVTGAQPGLLSASSASSSVTAGR